MKKSLEEKYKTAEKKLYALGEELSDKYRPKVEELVKDNKFNEAREYLRPFPYSPGKGWLFRYIIINEDAFKEKNPDS